MTIDLSGNPIVIEVDVTQPTIEVAVGTGPTIEIDIEGGGQAGPPGPPGPEGDPGPPGPAGSGAQHLQFTFAAPLNDWVIVHNLGSQAVEVNCYDLTGVFQFDPEIEATDLNTVTVRWYYPTAGVARVLG